MFGYCQGFTYVAPSILEEMHKPKVVKARSPRKGMFQTHSSTPFGGVRSQPQLAAEQPNGLGQRTTGFCLSGASQYPQPQELDGDEMMDTSTSGLSSPQATSHYYGNNYPIPPHL